MIDIQVIKQQVRWKKTATASHVAPFNSRSYWEIHSTSGTVRISEEEFNRDYEVVCTELPRLIGLCGVAGSGKDTVAKILFNYGYQRIAFADPVKACAIAIDPFVKTPDTSADCARLSSLIKRTLGGVDSVKHYPDVRRLLQRIGTEMGRNILGEDTWLNLARSKWQQPEPAKFVITDLRFPGNEVDALKEDGAVIWRIVRPGHDNGVGTAHASENQVNDIAADLEIINDGTLKDLEAKVIKAAGLTCTHCGK